MPRSSKSTPFKSQVFSVPKRRTDAVTALVASAQNFTIDPEERTQSRWKMQGWQKVIWNYFDIIPEFHYAMTWVGSMLSQARLYPCDADGKEITEGPAKEALDEFFGGADGQREFLRVTGIHLSAVGDQFVFADYTTPEPDWFVAPSCETRKDADGQTWRVNDESFRDALAIRMWSPHPKDRRYSDSPARACLPILAELDGLTKRVAATIDSRLASAGILAIPNEVTFSSIEGATADGKTTTAGESNAFVANLIHTMATAIKDRESAAALVPIVLQMPGEFVDKIKLISLSSDLDEHAKDLRDEAIRRLALGLDMPPEILEGTADMNHWSSWQVEEAAIKTHSEPKLAIIASSVLTGFLRPALQGVAGVAPEDVYIGVDDTKLRLRPNRSKEAMELYDRGQLSAAALRRENGFDETDAMDPKELIQFLTIAIARGSATPDQVAAAANALGLELPSGVNDQQETREERPRPSLGEHPVHELPPLSNGELDGENSALVAGAGLAVHRALERAGNRLRGKAKVKRADTAAEEYLAIRVTESEMPDLLEDAWNEGVVGFARDLGVPAANLTALLDSYTRTLISTQTAHSPEAFREYLNARRAA